MDKTELIEEINIKVEKFRLRILLLVNDLFLELTDEGLVSFWKVKFGRFDIYKHNTLTIKQLNEVLEYFSLELLIYDDSGNDINNILFNFLSDPDKVPIDDYIRVTNEYFLNIKALGEALGYNDITINNYYIGFKK